MHTISPVGDYWRHSFTVSSDFGSGYEVGAFYVRTTNGTTYWRKAGDGGDFYVGRGLFDGIEDIKGHASYDYRPEAGVPTQHEQLVGYWNPDRCF